MILITINCHKVFTSLDLMSKAVDDTFIVVVVVVKSDLLKRRASQSEVSGRVCPFNRLDISY